MIGPTRAVLFAGGGTAGHVFPALAVARALVDLEPDIVPVFVGTADRLEDRLVPAAGFRLHHVEAIPLPRRLSPELLRVRGALGRAVDRCQEVIAEEGVIGAATFGGYVSFPASWAAAKAGLPLVLHEQNAVPGIANRFAARWAMQVAVSFPTSIDRFGDHPNVIVTGNPVRDAMLDVDVDARRAAARESFGLDPRTTTLLVFGGSQGARSLNEAVLAAASRWEHPERLQILHGAGAKLHEEALDAWAGVEGGPKVVCVDFIEDMAGAYAAADVVLCRAGATSIAELTVLGRPSVLVPYPYATRDHQLHNAEALAEAGAAIVIEDDDLDGDRLVAAVQPWLAEPAERRRVGLQAQMFGRRDAAVTVARAIAASLREPDARVVPGDDVAGFHKRPDDIEDDDLGHGVIGQLED